MFTCKKPETVKTFSDKLLLLTPELIQGLTGFSVRETALAVLMLMEQARMKAMKEITVQKLKEKIENEEDFFLLDVREPFEQYQANIEYEHSALIPVSRLEGQLEELDSRQEDEIICMCRSGGRSNEAFELLEEKGFKNVKVLKGGINQWAKEIDNSLPVY